jgi:hypothetical protein
MTGLPTDQELTRKLIPPFQTGSCWMSFQNSRLWATSSFSRKLIQGRAEQADITRQSVFSENYSA